MPRDSRPETPTGTRNTQSFVVTEVHLTAAFFSSRFVLDESNCESVPASMINCGQFGNSKKAPVSMDSKASRRQNKVPKAGMLVAPHNQYSRMYSKIFSLTHVLFTESSPGSFECVPIEAPTQSRSSTV